MTEEGIRERIDYEIIVDCYDEHEQGMGWITYLEENMEFPFKARIIEKSRVSALKVDDIIKVIGIDIDVEPEHFHHAEVEVEKDDRQYFVPLSNIKGIDADEETEQAINDWHFWKKEYFKFGN
ncbi:calcium-binding protein [Candidatus Halobeggiatoa sp. HSG11]|nr:calcium-binding protein [Candidatus Halobeggiatoa sp. HSG11]